jgi:uncharacterized protein (TIGR02594 family)
MRCSRSVALAAGAVGVIALSIPAFATPLPPERPARLKQHASPSERHRANPENRHRAREPAQRVAAFSRPPLGSFALVVEARKYIGTNPTDRKKLWCATFMNFILHKLGYAGTNSDAAKSFVYYGHRISAPRVGAIAVLRRGKHGGHVGVVSGIDPSGNPIIISGNHNKRVGVGVYPRSRVIAYVMPTEMRSTPVEVAGRSGATRNVAQHGLDSPIAELLAAIRAEQERRNSREAAHEARAMARPTASPPPHRTIQQLPGREAANHRLGLAPALAELFGVADGAPPNQPIAR